MRNTDVLRVKALDSAIHFLREPTDRYALVDRFYRSQGYKVKAASIETLFTLHHIGQSEDIEQSRDIKQSGAAEIIAAARLVPQSSGHYWLRNLLVAKDWRGKGLASSLMQQLLPLLAPQGCYCFALPHLHEFYTRLGFNLEPEHCPDDIRQKHKQYRDRGRDWLLMGYRGLES